MADRGPRSLRNVLGEWKGEVRELSRALRPVRDARLRELSGIGRYMPDLLTASLVVNLLGLALPLTLLQVYDRILPNSSTDTLIALVIGVLVAQVLEAVLKVARSAITGWTSARFEHMASGTAFNSLLTMPVGKFETKGTGVHMETLNAIHTLKEFYSGQAFLAVFDLPFALLYLALMAAFGGWLVMVPAVLIGLFWISAVAMGRKVREAVARRMASDDSRINFVIEVLSGIQTVKALAMEAQMMRRHDRLLENSAQAEFHVAELSAKTGALALLFSHLTTILVVAFGSIEVIHGDMTSGVLAACSLLAGRCVQPMQAALDRWTRFQTARLAEERLKGLLAGDTASGKPELPAVEGNLRLEGVTVDHEGAGEPVLRDLDLSVPAGTLVGLQGENGSGKSTFLGLVAAWVAPNSGRVLVDGHDLSAYDPQSVRRQIAYIPQRPELFRGTILENLTLFDPAKVAEAKALARRLGIDRVVARLPLGYDTVVGEGAAESLPRGIRQLIVIAQALVHKPRIVLFDEANSAVDGASDQLLRQLLEEMRGSVTIFLVTPRPSLLSVADVTYRLMGGRLVDTRAVATLPSAQPCEPLDVSAAQPLVLRARAEMPAAEAVAHEVEREAEPEASTDFLREIERGSPMGRCLMPLLKAMGWRGELRSLAEALPHFQPSLDITAFRNVMANLGHGSSGTEVRGQLLDSRLLPCLFVDVVGRPFVLSAAPEGGILRFDGAEGGERVEPEQKLWGTAYFFTPLDESSPTLVPGQWFKSVVARFHGLLWSVLGQSLVINILSLGVPLFTMSVYDKVISSGDVGMLVSFLVGVLIVIAGDEVLRELRTRATGYVGSRIGFVVASAVFERTLLLPLPLTEKASIGSQLARFKDLESFRDFFGGGIAGVLLDLPFVLLYLAVLVALGGWIAAVPVAALTLFALMVTAIMPLVRRRVSTAGRASTKRSEFVVESLLKMRSLRAAALEPVWRNRFRGLASTAAMAGYESTTLSAVLSTASQSLVILSGLATMGAGVHQVLAGEMTAGALIASMMVVWRVLAPIQTGFGTVQRVEQTRASIRQLETLMGFRTELDGYRNAGKPRLKGAVNFGRVSIRYSNDADPALLGISFQANPGEVIAIVGPDGAGKSTLLKLAAGLYAPQAGNVMIDDLDIRQLSPVELRKAIGYAPQAPQLFFGTIAQNLRLAHPTASDADLRWALEAAGAWDEVAALPKGLETRVGDARTNRMSPSLAQGISLARAYIKRSPILLLDEPVTGLDFEGDRRFRQFVEANRGSTTILMVTHRPSHLSLADQILVLEHGAVRLFGPAAEVRQKLAAG